jgi:hypothetical protein
MSFDPWKDETNDPLELVHFDGPQTRTLKFLSNAAYYLCCGLTGLVLREDYYDGARPGIIGVLSVRSSPSKHLKRGHLTPLDQRFVFDRSNGLYIVNGQAYFDFNEHVRVVDRVAGRNIEFVVQKSL